MNTTNEPIITITNGVDNSLVGNLKEIEAEEKRALWEENEWMILGGDMDK